MISTTVRPTGRNYLCDDCRKVLEVFKSHKAAIAAGWAVSRDYKNCYCPHCAPKHRHTGRGGAKSYQAR